MIQKTKAVNSDTISKLLFVIEPFIVIKQDTNTGKYVSIINLMNKLYL